MKTQTFVIVAGICLFGFAVWGYNGKPVPVKAKIAVEQPQEKVYVWDNNSPSGYTVRVWHDPKTMCAYLLGAHVGMTLRYTKSGKPDCPGVL